MTPTYKYTLPRWKRGEDRIQRKQQIQQYIFVLSRENDECGRDTTEAKKGNNI